MSVELHRTAMRLHELVDNRKLLAVFVLGVSLLLILLDYLNPFIEYRRSWDILYVIRNLFAYYAILAPAYVILGCFVGKDDTLKLFFSCVWIPAICFALKGLVLLVWVTQDPNVLAVMGSEVDLPFHDWRDLAVMYYGGFLMWLWLIWPSSIALMMVGVIVNYLFGKGIGKTFENISRKLRNR